MYKILFFSFFLSCNQATVEPADWVPEPEEVNLFSALVNSECDVCPTKEKLLIIATPKNRARSSGKSLEAVICSPDQFCTDQNFAPGADTTLVILALCNPSMLDTNVYYFALKGVWKPWMLNKELLYQEKYHNFYGK